MSLLGNTHNIVNMQIFILYSGLTIYNFLVCFQSYSKKFTKTPTIEVKLC